MKNRFALNSSRSITWGDNMRSFGVNYGQSNYFSRQRTYFRHLTSTSDMTFAFGKHRGHNVSETNDFDYMTWVLYRFRLQPYQRQVLEEKLTLDLKQILAKISTKPTNPNQNPTKPQMKKLTFATAVLDAVCDFTNLNRNFSAFDVTRELRDRVNTGVLTVLDGTPTTFRGRTTTSIPHNTVGNEKGVRDIVHEIFAQNDVTGYAPQDTGHFIIYTYQGATPAPTPAPTPVSALAARINSVTTGAPAPAQAAKLGKQPASRLGQRIDTYIRGAAARGLAPTLKQIQSAVRREGNFLCDTLLTEATNLGFRVNKASELSKSTVSL